jgi:hypothetical protein
MSVVPLTTKRPVRPTVLVSSVLRGRESMITVVGTVDREGAVRIGTLVRGLCDAGATQVLLDLVQVSTCDPSLAGALDFQRRRLAAAGGWLIVDGSPATLGDDLGLPLLETFRIYREVCALTANR